METATSFTSRRPAAGALPAFSLPPPTSDIPRTAEGISPSLSSVNTGSSQGSQAPSNIAPYSFGHMHGAWQTPGHTSYNLSSAAQQPSLNVGSFGAPRPSLYNQTSTMGYGGQRESHSPTTAGDSLPPPPQDHLHQPFPTPLSSHNTSGNPSYAQSSPHSVLGSQTTSQSPGQSNHLPHLDTFSNGRSQSASSYPLQSSGAQQSAFSPYAPIQSPTQPSATSASPGLRGISSMAPPAPYRPPFQGYPLPGVNGAVMSNVHHPGGSMSIVGAMGMPGYHNHPMMYGQAPPQAAQERPFKCDVCIQAFSRNHDLKRHKRIHLSVKPFPCPHCSKSFSRKDALKRHKLVKGCEKKDADKASPDGVENGEADDDMKRE